MLPSSSNKETSKFPWGLKETETATFPPRWWESGREAKGWEMGLKERHEVRGELVCFGKGESGNNLMVVVLVAIN